MRTTGIFTVHTYTIKAKTIGEPIYLIPFGDVHRFSPMCHEEKWLEFLDWAKAKQNAYFLGMGDYDDMGSTSERMVLRSEGLHDSTHQTLSKLYNYNTEKLFKEIAFMKGKLIGLIEGNHYAEYDDGTTTTQQLCRMLGTKYLGVSAFVRIFVRHGKRSNHVDIWLHHGKGGGRLVGGSLNKVAQMGEIAEADIYLMGDDHKKSIGMADRLVLNTTPAGGTILCHKKQLYARTGSFLKGYEDGKKSYVVDMGLNPTNLGVVKIEMTPRRNRKDGTDEYYLDLHASI